MNKTIELIKKYSSYILGYGLLIVFGVGIIIGESKSRNLKNRGILEKAYIYKIEELTRSFIVYYSFEYEGREYRGDYTFSYWREMGNRLSYKYYPVLFDPENPKNSSLLLFDSNFERFGYTPPDSIVNR